MYARYNEALREATLRDSGTAALEVDTNSYSTTHDRPHHAGLIKLGRIATAPRDAEGTAVAYHGLAGLELPPASFTSDEQGVLRSGRAGVPVPVRRRGRGGKVQVHIHAYPHKQTRFLSLSFSRERARCLSLSLSLSRSLSLSLSLALFLKKIRTHTAGWRTAKPSFSSWSL
jgi:hypothetical protein